MKSDRRKSAAKKTMRVSTVFAGVAAAANIFGPAAQAAPDNPPVASPFVIWVKTGESVLYLQVCAYKDLGTGSWYCTAVQSNPGYLKSVRSNYMGINWKRGKTRVYEWPNGALPPYSPYTHACNTNGSYHGLFRTGEAGSGVALSAGSRRALVLGASNC
jgi:hypothetical protein